MSSLTNKEYRTAWITFFIYLLTSFYVKLLHGSIRADKQLELYIGALCGVVFFAAAIWCFVYGIKLAKTNKNNKAAAVSILLGCLGLFAWALAPILNIIYNINS
jgi:hypothetical protein